MVIHQASGQRVSKLAALGLLVVSCLGCGAESRAPLEGTVLIEPESGFQFSGDTLEIRSISQPSEVAYGEIKPDGSFRIESLVNGVIVQGASAGEYEARIVVADDDSQHKASALKAIPKKYLQFATSGLKVTAPQTHWTIKLSK